MAIGLPQVVVHIICQYAARWTILPWVDMYAPKSVQGENDDNVPCELSYMTYLFANPLAYDLFTKKIDDSLSDISWEDLSRNPSEWALDLLESNQDKIDPSGLCRNTNHRVIKLLESIPRENWDLGFMAANPTTVQLIVDKLMNINPSWIMWNPGGENLICRYKIPIDYSALAGNPASWAVEMVKKYFTAGGDINWTALCANYHSWAIEKIREEIMIDPCKICWVNLSANPGAINILNANRDKITIEIWENPAIFELTIPSGLDAVIMLL